MYELVFVIALAGLILIGLWYAPQWIKIIVVHDYQVGLLYQKGRFSSILPAGRYVCIETFTSIVRYDLRTKDLHIRTLQIITKDKVAVKITIQLLYRITDPLIVQNRSCYLDDELRAYAEAAIRDAVATLTLDEFFERSTELDKAVLVRLIEKTANFGFEIEHLALKDLVLPANLKRAYASVLEAKKDALKKLEQARGEQAVLRNLANASAMYDKNPMLLQARLIQALSNGTNTIVFKAGEGLSLPQGASDDRR
jgi:regulator of protease activity HflC (stomatin/prohibitin superfamily)